MTVPPIGPTAPAVSWTNDVNTLLAIIDFSYQHYALGDLLTIQVEQAVQAIEQGIKHIDLIVVIDPALPGARLQGYITPQSYVTHLDGLLPVFTCGPLLRSLHVLRDVSTLALILEAQRTSGAPMWPTLATHLRMRQSYPVDHLQLNAFYARHGYLPQLCAPRHHEPWARRFHAQELSGHPLVVINPRQSTLTDHPSAIHRESPL